MKIKLVVLFFALIVLFSACSNKENENKDKEDLKIVFATKPKSKDLDEFRVFDAVAKANEQMKLSFKVQGNLEVFKLDIGDEVRKNQLLASLDKEPYLIQVSQIQYALKEAKASLKYAKSTYERTKKLYINQNASASDIDNAKASYDAAKAKVKNINKQLDYAKLQLSYTKLYAPISGFISSKYVNESENVSAGTPIVLLSDKIVNEVYINMPESIINRLSKEQKVQVSFDSLPSKKFNGFISEISKTASSNEKTYLVIVKLKESSSLIKVGMSAEVSFNFENLHKNIFLLPHSSVLNDKKDYFVYVLQKENDIYKIRKNVIKVGQLTSEGYEVLSGIKGSELVLKAGMSEVFEDMSVKIGNIKKLDE